MSKIPKIIWMYWHQGWDKAPTLVKQCKKSWLHYNPDYEIRFLDKKSILPYFNYEDWMPDDLKNPINTKNPIYQIQKKYITYFTLLI